MQITKKYIKIIGYSCIISSLIISAISIFFAFTLNIERSQFFEREGIVYQKFSVKMQDGVKIHGLLYVDKDLYYLNNESVYTILMLNGINSRKEDNFYKAYQLVKRNYAVISIEQRGHGESGGPSGFLGKEPYDMIEIINFIEANFQFVNSTYLGLLGFSYGGGIGAILQAIDFRIHTSVLYHPLSSLNSLLENIPLQNLIGTTPSIQDIEQIEDAFEIANESNTNNLLLIHGTEDILIFPEDSIGFYNLLNGSNRSDIELILRAGLDHGGNEANMISLKLSLLWFEHFYHNNSIDITNLENESLHFVLFEMSYPNSSVSEILIIISVIFLFLGMSILIIKLKIFPSWYKLSKYDPHFNEREGRKIYKNMIFKRTTIYISSALVIGIICAIFNTSLLYGYFILYPLLNIILLIFIPSELHRNWKEEWKSWLKKDSKLFICSTIVILIPIILFLVIYNINKMIMLKPIIPVVSNSLIPYLFIGFGSGIMDYLYLRELKNCHTYILLEVRPISLLIFFIFVPVQPFPILGGLTSHIFFILLFGIITLYIRQLIMVLSKFFKNSMSLYILVMFPFIIFFTDIFFRII